MVYDSSNFSDLKEPGLRKKPKKKLERGEMGWYDPDRAQAAVDAATDKQAKALNKRMGIKWGKK